MSVAERKLQPSIYVDDIMIVNFQQKRWQTCGWQIDTNFRMELHLQEKLISYSYYSLWVFLAHVAPFWNSYRQGVFFYCFNKSLVGHDESPLGLVKYNNQLHIQEYCACFYSFHEISLQNLSDGFLQQHCTNTFRGILSSNARMVKLPLL